MRDPNFVAVGAKVDEFILLADLGDIVVPPDYDHATRLGVFRKRNREQLYYHALRINDGNFANPSRVLRPGERLRVRVWKQNVFHLTSEDCLEFIRRAEKNQHVGAQGLSLVFEQKRDELPKGLHYASFDDKDRLCKSGGKTWVPFLSPSRDGLFRIDLAEFDRGRHVSDAFFVFSEIMFL